MKPFNQWTYEEVEEVFELQKNDDLNTLKIWLTELSEVDESLFDQLHELKNDLKERVLDWNEEELKFFFIGPLIRLVNFYDSRYSAFTNRPLQVDLDGEKLGGSVDFMVARGKQQPRQPYFFIHEYKKELGNESDPLGQLLVAMKTAQIKNHHLFPIYGAYVVGRHWHFVVLEGGQYAVSAAYDATREEIFDIFAVLVRIKGYIEQNMEKEESLSKKGNKF